jgi:hypothetical protein
MSIEEVAFWRVRGCDCFLHVEVSSAKKTSVDRKRARSEHRASSAEGCQHDGNPRIAKVVGCDPQFCDGDQRSHEGRPESDEEKHSGACTNDVRNHGCGKRQIGQVDYAEADEHNCNHNALDQKTDTRPTIGKCRIKSLQELLPQERRRIAKKTKHLKVGTFFLLLANI